MKQFMVRILIEEKVMATNEAEAAELVLELLNQGKTFTMDNISSVGEVVDEEDIEVSTEPEEEEE